MNNPFDYTPAPECDAAFRRLLGRIDELRAGGRPDDAAFCRELDTGKMLGVLIAVDQTGTRHTLYAFSGQIGDDGFIRDGFVGPVFDYLRPDGHFKTKEAGISALNMEIARFERDVLGIVASEYALAKEKADAEVVAFREKCLASKRQRDLRRASGLAGDSELADMVRRSQYEKAELRRLRQRLRSWLEPIERRLDDARSHLEEMKLRRRTESEELQAWLFSNFTLLNARGESRSLADIFAATPMGVPPSGAGECCAPKLLQAAFVRGWHPVAMAEYWHGQPRGGEVRIHGAHYPACRGKCLPVLDWMLRGLDITPPLGHDRATGLSLPEPTLLFENEWFCVVNKPSGMLSAPGKGKTPSVQRWLESRYGADRQVKTAHRLDQDTSGLLVATFGPVAFKTMQGLFATRCVSKTYEALLEGDYESHGLPRCGRIELPLSPDWLDRPRQRVDLTDGKSAVTDYEFTDVADGMSRVTFRPLTGRTHQLRVHAASASGLGMPIAGDRLYGTKSATGAPRLMLHAARLEFTFPLDGRCYAFDSPVPF